MAFTHSALCKRQISDNYTNVRRVTQTILKNAQRVSLAFGMQFPGKITTGKSLNLSRGDQKFVIKLNEDAVRARADHIVLGVCSAAQQLWPHFPNGQRGYTHKNCSTQGCVATRICCSVYIYSDGLYFLYTTVCVCLCLQSARGSQIQLCTLASRARNV